MTWIYLIAIAFFLGILGKALKSSEEVHSIAVTVAGLISLLWGFAWAPPSMQLLIGGVLFGVDRFYAMKLQGLGSKPAYKESPDDPYGWSSCS